MLKLVQKLINKPEVKKLLKKVKEKNKKKIQKIKKKFLQLKKIIKKKKHLYLINLIY